MKNLLCVVILKILLLGLIFFRQPHRFLRESPVALEYFFKINLNGQNHLCTDVTQLPTETKINHQLITDQTKIKLYPLDTCLHIPY